MKVALDSNILCADFRLNSGAFQVFLSALSRLGAACCVPEVVRDEVVALHRRNLDDAARNAQKWSRTWGRLTGSPSESSPTPTELDAQTARYAQFLTDVFREHSVELLPYPSISHQALVSRAIARRKPFAESGSGYRDSLIWATIVELTDVEEGRVILVTNNSKDFGVAPDLHPDLSCDLSGNKTVELYNSLESFNAACVVPHLEHLESVLRELQQGTHTNFSLSDWIATEMVGLLNQNDDGSHFVGIEPSHGHVWVSELKSQGAIIVDDVRLLPPADLLVLANVDLKLEVAVSADWDDCGRYPDVREFFDGDCSGNPTAWVEQEGNVAFTLTLNGPSLEVDGADIDQIWAEYDIEINPHPRRHE